jgi:aspartate aminotransferase-like enzyme
VRALFASKGYTSVAAEGFGTPSVVVLYTDDTNIHNGSKFKAAELQIAAGVPLRCDETADYKTFKIGLFGIDKLQNVDHIVVNLADALDKIA